MAVLRCGFEGYRWREYGIMDAAMEFVGFLLLGLEPLVSRIERMHQSTNAIQITSSTSLRTSYLRRDRGDGTLLVTQHKLPRAVTLQRS